MGEDDKLWIGPLWFDYDIGQVDRNQTILELQTSCCISAMILRAKRSQKSFSDHSCGCHGCHNCTLKWQCSSEVFQENLWEIDQV